MEIGRIMNDRISTLDAGYITGDLSIFPQAVDTKSTLYEVRNGAETHLTQSVTYGGGFLVVNDASKFPSEGLIRVGTELMYYGSRSDTIFRNLKRGFAGSRRNTWSTSTKVQNAVMAESHNALKDAILNIQANVGKMLDPDPDSLNGILTNLEVKFLSPQPKFRAFPLTGAPSLPVRFQNFSGGPPIRFFWDFGDGTTTVDVNPTHTYLKEGVYTVKMQMITSLGGQGIVTKTDYINVNKNAKLPLFYAETLIGTSEDTAGDEATVFKFVDQTDGDIASRYWIWDDGTNSSELDPDVHDASHVYQSPGVYSPVLLCVFKDGGLKRISLTDVITVT
jgi:PKD repeat protein